METLEQRQTQIQNLVQSNTTSTTKTFMSNVFAWMFVALGISAIMAYAFASSNTLLSYMYDPMTGARTILGTITMFAPLAFVLLMSFGYQKLSAPVMTLLFLLYAAINGVSFSYILLVYTSNSVIGAFASAAVMFGVMAVLGYTTNKDLTSFGRIMMMGLIGIVVASIINIFLHSDSMGYIISIIGVAVFTGLTAYDVQKLKNIGNGIDANGDAIGSADIKKRSIMGALNLYLDFINLFLMLLRMMGSRK